MVESNQIDIAPKKLSRQCRYGICTTRATFSLPASPSNIYCLKHKTPEMVSVQNNKCNGENCKKQGSFKGEGNKLFCLDHKPENAFRASNDMCKEKGCKIRATFGLKTDMKAVNCKEHKKSDMIDISNPKCTREGCEVREYRKSGKCEYHLNEPSIDEQLKKLLIDALVEKFATDYIKPQKNRMFCAFEDCQSRGSFGVPNQQKPKIKYCLKHKTDEMIDLVHKSCVFEDCNERACYNFQDEIKALYCFAHQQSGMISTSRQYCQYHNCGIRASFGLDSDRKRVCCNSHKTNDMVLLDNVECREANCTTRPHFNFPCNTKPLTCYRHKEFGMVNIYQKKCQKCEITARYDGLCSKCFYEEFPDNQCTRQYKIKERAVVKFLQETGFPTLINDKMIQGGQSNYRPDILIQLSGHNIIIEVDEHNHSVYDKQEEKGRQKQIFFDLEKKPLTIIRFNPDGYLQQTIRIRSPWTYLSRNEIIIQDIEEWQTRLQVLRQTVSDVSQVVPQGEITEIYLFGDQ